MRFSTAHKKIRLTAVADLIRNAQLQVLGVHERGHRQVVDIFQDVRCQPAGDDLGHRRHDLIEVGERGQHAGAVVQTWMQLDDHLGGQGQGAFRADDELGQVVAGGHLGDLAAGSDDLAGRQHCLQPQHVMAGYAVLDRAHTAGVRADVAADARRQLTWMNHVPQPGIDGRGVQFGQRQPGLDDGDLVSGVYLQYPIHSFERDQQAVLARPRGSRQAAPGPACRHRGSMVGGGRQQSRNLFCGGRFDDVGRPLRRLRQLLVVGIVVGNCVAGEHIGAPDDVHQPRCDVTHGRPRVSAVPDSDSLYSRLRPKISVGSQPRGAS
ncbi:hypothetical protein LAUMK35_03658 [Mycobacterium pseudokansasii]|nr:hypothetical protein LAUMK35_03658 [Mycobacterium pseudokansasii]VAZ98846.1 hypothetical protein LAUMK21_03655 [Mycobacterium pseudokansasii]